MDRKGIRLKTPPAAPVPPDQGFCSAALPAWMYRDPADVVERIEQAGIAKAERERRRKNGLLGECTVRLIKQMRIRELVAKVMKGER